MNTFTSDLRQNLTVALPPGLLREVASAPIWARVALPLIMLTCMGVARLVGRQVCVTAKRRNKPESRLVRFTEVVNGPA